MSSTCFSRIMTICVRVQCTISQSPLLGLIIAMSGHLFNSIAYLLTLHIPSESNRNSNKGWLCMWLVLYQKKCLSELQQNYNFSSTSIFPVILMSIIYPNTLNSVVMGKTVQYLHLISCSYLCILTYI